MSIITLLSLALLGTTAHAASSPTVEAQASASASAHSQASGSGTGTCSSTASSQAELRVGDKVVKKSAQKSAQGNNGACSANSSASVHSGGPQSPDAPHK